MCEGGRVEGGASGVRVWRVAYVRVHLQDGGGRGEGGGVGISGRRVGGLVGRGGQRQGGKRRYR